MKNSYPKKEYKPYIPLPKTIKHIQISKIAINTLKTHSGTKKRWTALPSGKFKRRKAGKTHLNSGMVVKNTSYIKHFTYSNPGKSSARLNRLKKTAYADGGKSGPQTQQLKRLLPFR
ncbi:hypothetical protein PCK1_000244 [Pneumocystis canis]|nr:hypothetical protein PCK1_000244 [Pneumocystis canis]